jgi:hypothetical protein
MIFFFRSFNDQVSSHKASCRLRHTEGCLIKIEFLELLRLNKWLLIGLRKTMQLIFLTTYFTELD